MGGGDYMYGAITSSPFDSPFPTPSPSPVSLFDLETLGFLIIKTIPPKITQAQKNNTNKQLNKMFFKKGGVKESDGQGWDKIRTRIIRVIYIIIYSIVSK